MGSSLRSASSPRGRGRHQRRHGPRDRVVVTLVDLPGLTVRGRAPSRGAESDDPGEALAAATYDGSAVIPSCSAAPTGAVSSATATGDRGARTYLAEHDVRLVEVGDVATGDDLDTPMPEPHPRFHD